MNDQATLQLMRTLRLTGMADRFEALQTLPTHQQPSHDVLLPQLLESEDLYRNHRKTQTAIRNARFRYQASLSEIVCNTERNFSKDTLSTLSASYRKRPEPTSKPSAIMSGSGCCPSPRSPAACARTPDRRPAMPANPRG